VEKLVRIKVLTTKRLNLQVAQKKDGRRGGNKKKHHKDDLVRKEEVFSLLPIELVSIKYCFSKILDLFKCKTALKNQNS